MSAVTGTMRDNSSSFAVSIHLTPIDPVRYGGCFVISIVSKVVASRVNGRYDPWDKSAPVHRSRSTIIAYFSRISSSKNRLVVKWGKHRKNVEANNHFTLSGVALSIAIITKVKNLWILLQLTTTLNIQLLMPFSKMHGLSHPGSSGEQSSKMGSFPGKILIASGLQQMLDIACICTIFTYKSTMTTTKLRINITKTLRLKIL
ncbi:hypothetical protein HUJ04_007032 [Dendroctonus ponderosae]|nr:hypothetical protein HUJ04_007032 [Dendroctonus ponderosae]